MIYVLFRRRKVSSTSVQKYQDSCLLQKVLKNLVWGWVNKNWKWEQLADICQLLFTKKENDNKLIRYWHKWVACQFVVYATNQTFQCIVLTAILSNNMKYDIQQLFFPVLISSVQGRKFASNLFRAKSKRLRSCVDGAAGYIVGLFFSKNIFGHPTESWVACVSHRLSSGPSQKNMGPGTRRRFTFEFG